MSTESNYPRAYIQTLVGTIDTLNGRVDPPNTEPEWKGGPWKLMGVTHSLYIDDRIVIMFAWTRKGQQ